MITVTTPDLSRLFVPESVALVGASGDPNKLSGRPHQYMDQLGYDGDLFLVNPKRAEIDGHVCYDSLDAVPGPVDLALVLVPARIAPSVIVDCGRNDVPFALVIASGFSEAGSEGSGDEAELLAAAESGGVRLIGPNSEGLVNVGERLGASFSSILKRDDLTAGDVAIVSQSGAFGGALFQVLQDEGIGVGTWLSTGNDADLTTLDYLSYLVDDPDTDLVVTYVESLDRGDRVLELGRRAAETGTDLVVINAGSSDRGQEAAASHTGSVASSHEVYDAVLRAAGVARTHGVDDTVGAVRALRTVPRSRRPDDGEGLGVLSVSGGAAVLVADAADRVGLPMATFTEETRRTVGGHIPAYGSETNPVDVTGAVIGDPDVFANCVRTVAADPGVGPVLLQFGNSGDETIEACKEDLLAIPDDLDCPVAAVFTGSQPDPETRWELTEHGVLVFRDPVRAVETMAVLRETDPQVIDFDPDDGRDISPDHARCISPDDDVDEITAALRSAGVEVAETVRVDDADDAVSTGDRLGYPVVCKLDPVAVQHKTEHDGVRVGLDDPAAVHSAYADLTDVGPVVVQEQIAGVEAHVGFVEDSDVGPVMTVGPGGEFVELVDDRAYRPLPIDRETAREALAETPLDDLLDGYRGAPAADREALAELLVAASDSFLASDCETLELNPVVVTPERAVAVDVLVA